MKEFARTVSKSSKINRMPPWDHEREQCTYLARSEHSEDAMWLPQKENVIRLCHSPDTWCNVHAACGQSLWFGCRQPQNKHGKNHETMGRMSLTHVWRQLREQMGTQNARPNGCATVAVLDLQYSAKMLGVAKTCNSDTASQLPHAGFGDVK